MKLQVSVGLIALVLVGCGDDAGATSREDEDAGERGDAAPPSEPSKQTIVGGTCSQDTDCERGRCLSGETVTGVQYPGGYCSGSCMQSDECGEGAVCWQSFRSRPGTCYAGCESDSDCRDGYRCRVSAATGVGACLPGQKPLSVGVVGAMCSSDEDCGGATMSCRHTFTDVEAPGGYCTLACAMHADCGEDGFCVSAAPNSNFPVGICFRTCTPPGGCREGYMCQALSGANEESRGVCTPTLPATTN